MKPSRSEYPDCPRLAVGAVVFHDQRVLLVRRGRPPAQGQWAIPGGSVRLGETLREAVEREILEETGIRISAGEPVLTFEVIERDSDHRVRFHYLIVDYAADYLGGTLKAGDDAAEAKWVAASELTCLPVHVRTLKLLKEQFSFAAENAIL